MTLPSASRLSFVLLCLLASASSAQDRDEKHLRRHTSMGNEVVIRGHSEWNADCVALAPPEIKILEAPQHGSIDLRPGETRLGTNKVGETNCEGRTGQGILVVYVPEANYRGADSVTYQIIYRQGGAWTLRADITVE